ncbi:MAG: 3-deoxy-D-manno-octulosonic acid transferase [Lacipirellulaceae bacterium]
MIRSKLFSWLLNAVYATIIVLGLPWILWAAWRHGKYREGFGEKLLGSVPKRLGNRPCLWLHAVSVGEVNLLETLIDEIQTRSDKFDICISTTTKTGFDLARKKYGSHTVFYCPLDFSWAVHRAMQRVRPTALILAELELWPNLINAAKQHGAKVAIVNGRLSERSHRGYQRVAQLIAPVLRQIDLIAVQDETTAERFLSLSAKSNSVMTTGSLKFDGVETERKNPRTLELAKLAGVEETDVVFLAGSTQAPEEEVALEAFQDLSPQFPNLRLILVPRHPQRFEEVAGLLQQSGMPWQRRSLLKDQDSTNHDAKVLLVDTIGELSVWWGTAQIAFVGGSFGNREGQNMLEPAAYGAAVSFGPRTRNFRDIVSLLLANDGAIVLQEPSEMETFVQRCLENPQWAAELGNRSQKTVLSHQGATTKTVDLLLELLPEQADCLSKPRAA